MEPISPKGQKTLKIHPHIVLEDIISFLRFVRIGPIQVPIAQKAVKKIGVPAF
jgi:hypothetical protein